MNKILSKTLLSYRDALYVDDYRKGVASEQNNDAILALAADLGQLGYSLSAELIARLKTLSTKNLGKFHADAVALLREVVGANVRYAPLFRKFPDSIPSRDLLFVTVSNQFGLYSHILFYAVYGYWSVDDYNGTWFGRQFPGVVLEEAIRRPALVSTKPLKALGVATDADVLDVFSNLIGAKGSISATDKAFVSEVVAEYSAGMVASLPEEIPNKENLTYLIGAVAERHGMTPVVSNMFLPHMKTATDILRVAAAFSGSDVALADHKRFKLTNAQRKFVMKALDALNFNSATEDMLRFHGLWLVLAKYLHVNAYADKYPQATAMVQAIRDAAKAKNIPTFNRSIERTLLWEELKGKKLATFLKLVSTRPGDFARRLDHILRIVEDKNAVVDAFLAVADKVASPLLLNLATHMYHRDSKAGVRVFLPKGSTTNATVIRGDDRSLLPHDIAMKLSSGISTILSTRYADKGPLGKVYIDPALEDILVPTSMRDASESLKTVARGSKFSLGYSQPIVRMFLYWEDIEYSESYNNRVDVDLSVQLLTDDFRQNGVVSYYNLSGTGITHSGDFTSAPNGAAEFIDVEIDKVLKAGRGTRYLAMTVNSFSGQPFNQFTAKAGYMLRDGKSGKSFEAKAVEQKYEVTAGTKFAVPMLLDLVERKVIWLDIGLVDQARMFTNVGHKGADLSILSQYAVEMYREKANLLDLLLLHTKGRAESVSFEREEGVQYDTVFDMSFASRVDEIMSNWI